MSFTQSMRIARNYIQNASANLADSMQSENADPAYSIDLSISELESAILELKMAKAQRWGLGESRQ